MSAIVSGTFAGTGSSAVIYGTHISISMDFAGTASVDIEREITGGVWIKSVTGITADYDAIYDRPTGTNLRLTCTAHTNNVVYVLET